MDKLRSNLNSLRMTISDALMKKGVGSEEEMYGVISDVLKSYINSDTENFKGSGIRRNYAFSTNGNIFSYNDHNVFGSSDSGKIDMSQLAPYIVTKYLADKKMKENAMAEENKKYPLIKKLNNLSEQAELSYKKGWENANSRKYNLNNTVTLTSGKFRNTVVPKEMLDEIAKQADESGLDRKTAFGLIGQESTFGEGRNPESNTKRRDFGKNNSFRPDALASYWKGGRNTPSNTNYLDYFSRRGMKVERDPTNTDVHKLKLRIPTTAQDSINAEKFLQKNPNMVRDFEKEIKSFNNSSKNNYNIGNVYKQAFNYYKSGKYNPADKNHAKAVNNSANILSKDPALQSYFK